MIAQTKLESYFSNNKLNQSLCTCKVAPPELHIAAMVYLKCRYCNLPVSKVLSLLEATEIQNN